MKKLFQWASVAMIFSLSACGGSSADSEDTPAVAAPAIAQKHLTIMIRGDSTNYGSHPGIDNGDAVNQTPNHPAALMQSDLDALFGKDVITVINRAEPGSTLQDDLNGTGPYTMGTLASELAGSDADIIITNSELNDASANVTPAQYQADLEQWVAVVRAAGKTALIEEPNPTCIAPVDANGVRSIDSAYIDVQHAVSLALGVTVLHVTKAFASAPDWQASLLQSDCEHPSDAGYAFKEARYFNALVPIVRNALADIQK